MIYVHIYSIYVCEGLWVCVGLIALIDDCVICVSQVKLSDTTICLQSGPVVP